MRHQNMQEMLSEVSGSWEVSLLFGWALISAVHFALKMATALKAERGQQRDTELRDIEEEAAKSCADRLSDYLGLCCTCESDGAEGDGDADQRLLLVNAEQMNDIVAPLVQRIHDLEARLKWPTGDWRFDGEHVEGVKSEIDGEHVEARKKKKKKYGASKKKGDDDEDDEPKPEDAMLETMLAQMNECVGEVFRATSRISALEAKVKDVTRNVEINDRRLRDVELRMLASDDAGGMAGPCGWPANSSEA